VHIIGSGPLQILESAARMRAQHQIILQRHSVCMMHRDNRRVSTPTVDDVRQAKVSRQKSDDFICF